MKSMTESLTAITNGIVFTGEKLVSDRVVLIKAGKVSGLISTVEIPEGAEIVDAMGNYVVPGFIDLQIYGGGGRLFSASPTKKTMDEIAQGLVTSGTTSFMITVATNTMELVDEALTTLSDYRHPALLGLHLEGPYLNPAKRGAHPAAYIRKPEKSEISRLLDRGKGCLRMMTIAPERFDPETITLLLDRGVLLSAGHSDATFNQAMDGFGNGIQAVTHFFNAMSPFHHRNPGLPGATFQSDKVKASIIADGIHVDYQTLAISKRLLGDRLFLITDAVVEVNTGTYTHVFKGDRYTLPDGTLSGSALTMMQAVANCVLHVGISLEEALRMATLYPASLIGAAHLGRITTGATANVVVFDSLYTVKHVFLEGKRQ
ncbi:N-acetylglucosamine-6-phosphate deacetylase [Parapedobacter pyrenivorans]|uniref:N-acetylglucosamine-6-phosphate deacetylase n=1 Tax=Parapedobacter pyrenivorans TaxID=1305674 RepID=A0A917M6F6_9SPHI|nr:N-acetylglucosamine-6-phosphate deacetylase [Parapedobacter pyrenivorans]GGG77994.1 N-acetylglucosamine-6-phosphate deacetylase [Parapedobacter pyrenivorans]